MKQLSEIQRFEIALIRLAERFESGATIGTAEEIMEILQYIRNQKQNEQ